MGIRMKRKINIRIISLALLAILSTMLFVTITFSNMFKQQMMKDLQLYTEFLAKYETSEELFAMAVDLKEEGLRITLLSGDGTVLLDGEADVSLMENHANRPEIQAAVKNGEGQAIRISETLGRNTYYYAMQTEEGKILRVSTEAKNLLSFFVMLAPSLIFIVVVLFVMAFIVAHFLSKSLIRPIEQLAENMESNEEIAHYEELEPFVKMIREQHADILKSAKMRQEFTANVTHELKTPLTSISGYAELIENGMASEADVTRFAQGIRTNANRLLILINDIIRLSELDSVEEEVPMEKINLYEMASTCVEMLEPNAEKHGVTILLTGEDVYISGNKMMMEELLYNLCDNAIRYNNTNGSVTVDVCIHEKKSVLTVSDTGIGIPKEHQERIFERFYRVDKSRSKSTGGTGLGLAIVKHIIAKHHAILEVESEVGRGTTMRVIFNK